MPFDYTQDFACINFRRNPELYQIGRGEQGVLLVEPYKSEILPFWKFRTTEVAKESAQKIYQLFLQYKAQDDFVGMDMARKFLQMGYTRARRYANHKTGKKYVFIGGKKVVAPQEIDWNTSERAQSARIFYEKYLQAKTDPIYQNLMKEHKEKFEKSV